ncbi:Serine/threonine-protein kinase dkf-1 [Lachnellula suecica]|uniref:Serine/threonine-protein kinase dkf-1 n=1 Tax=Lachnellula suecica TaxID=602035 RepID=A0A8T9C7N9_9HELO|nr:Serine/threonine-protein kinase dkf-1 [Lachnellula suecica]
MDQEPSSYFDWVDSSVINDIETDFPSTFCASEKRSLLEVFRFKGRKIEDEDKNEKLGADIKPEQVSNTADLEHVAKSRDPCHIFCVGQRHSYSRLYISREIFEQLLDKYAIFDRIWDFVLPFSFKTRESDIGHAPFRFRQSESILNKTSMRLGTFECAYGFRYVELNHRKGLVSPESLDYDPWSVRQMAVYQQYNSSMDRLTFVLIAPSKKARERLHAAVRRSIDSKRCLNAFDLHRILISTLHENWRLYIRSLDKLLTEQASDCVISDPVMLAHVRSEHEKLSPLTDFTVNFIDRQRLKRIEDKVLDLVIVFESLYNTLSKLQRQCQLHCVEARCKDCSCSITIEEIEEQMNEVQQNLKKVEALHKKAQGTAHLLSDLLNYENAQIAHHNEKSLNDLAKESKEENSKMRILTERSSRDAAAVKILTVITLIYLPMTVVLNFFSTQLIHVDDFGRISIIPQSWWFVVIAIPLTIATFAIWKLWLSYTMRAQERKASHGFAEEKTIGRHLFFDYGVTEDLSEVQIEWPKGGNRFFTPVNRLNELVTPFKVEKALQNIYPQMIKDTKLLQHYTTVINSRSKRMFALLISGEERFRKAIQSFVDNGITDKDLPFSRAWDESETGFVLCKSEHQLTCGLEDHRLCGVEIISGWPQRQRNEFDRIQWFFQAPEFRRRRGKIPHFNLPENVVMPFTEDYEQNPNWFRTGGYSQVWAVRIHPAHHNLLTSTHPKGPLLAIKRLISRDEVEFQRETDFLIKLSKRNHPHLMKLLATYKLKRQYHLIFPYAKENLREYWASIDIPFWNLDTTIWFLRQIRGLVSALDTIHNFEIGASTLVEESNPVYDRFSRSQGVRLRADEADKFGRHGDLKPENVLLSEEGSSKFGRLQIADFGLGRFHRFESRSRQDPKTINGSPTYAPPEIALARAVSRAYDIWSLGCIFLEFITWLIKGSDGLENFNAWRELRAEDGISDDVYFTLITPDQPPNARPYAE